MYSTFLHFPLFLVRYFFFHTLTKTREKRKQPLFKKPYSSFSNVVKTYFHAIGYKLLFLLVSLREKKNRAWQKRADSRFRNVYKTLWGKKTVKNFNILQNTIRRHCCFFFWIRQNILKFFFQFSILDLGFWAEIKLFGFS